MALPVTTARPARDDIPELRDEIEKQHGDYGRQLVRRGYVVAAPCLTPFGRPIEPDVTRRPRLIRDVDPCADTFVRLSVLGKLLIAENLRDILWTFAYLSSAMKSMPSASVAAACRTAGG